MGKEIGSRTLASSPLSASPVAGSCVSSVWLLACELGGPRQSTGSPGLEEALGWSCTGAVLFLWRWSAGECLTSSSWYLLEGVSLWGCIIIVEAPGSCLCRPLEVQLQLLHVIGSYQPYSCDRAARKQKWKPSGHHLFLRS
ncbi:hypothetical protein VULLAG_LOCUS1534 [Vulpes lagopus]